ncbi:hypothetical protein [Rhodoflexus sp.]
MALVVPTELISNLSLEQTLDDIQATDSAAAMAVSYFETVAQAQAWLDK